MVTSQKHGPFGLASSTEEPRRAHRDIERAPSWTLEAYFAARDWRLGPKRPVEAQKELPRLRGDANEGLRSHFRHQRRVVERLVGRQVAGVRRIGPVQLKRLCHRVQNHHPGCHGIKPGEIGCTAAKQGLHSSQNIP